MKAIKILIGFSIAIIASLFLLINFSSVETKFKCDGKISDNGSEYNSIIFLKLEKYRWWVGLWSDSKGSAWIEIPNKTVEYFGYISGSGDVIQMGASPGEFGGVFSNLSKTIGVSIKPYGVFDGSCEIIR